MSDEIHYNCTCDREQGYKDRIEQLERDVTTDMQAMWELWYQGTEKIMADGAYISRQQNEIRALRQQLDCRYEHSSGMCTKCGWIPKNEGDNDGE